MKNASDYNLDAMVNSTAVDIFEEYCLDRDGAFDRVHEEADGNEWVIYHHKSHELCANCNTDMGEEAIEDMGGLPEGSTYNSIASLIAFWEVYYRLNYALNTLFEIMEANEEAECLSSNAKEEG